MGFNSAFEGLINKHNGLMIPKLDIKTDLEL